MFPWVQSLFCLAYSSWPRPGHSLSPTEPTPPKCRSILEPSLLLIDSMESYCTTAFQLDRFRFMATDIAVQMLFPERCPKQLPLYAIFSTSLFAKIIPLRKYKALRNLIWYWSWKISGDFTFWKKLFIYVDFFGYPKNNIRAFDADNLNVTNTTKNQWNHSHVWDVHVIADVEIYSKNFAREFFSWLNILSGTTIAVLLGSQGFDILEVFLLEILFFWGGVEA